MSDKEYVKALEEENTRLRAKLKAKQQANCSHDDYSLYCSSYENRAPYTTYKCNKCGYIWDESISC